MKFKIYIISTAILFIIGCLKNNDNLNSKKAEIIGNVTSKKEIVGFFHEKMGKYIKDTTFVFYGLFGTKGKILKSYSFEPDGTPAGNITYKYDDKENMIEKIQYVKGKLNNTSMYKYSKNGRKVEEVEIVYWTGGQKIKRTTFEYDNSGNEIASTFDENDVLSNVINSKYNNRGDVIEMTLLDQKGDLIIRMKFSYKYDDKGNILETKSDNGSVERYEYIYDNKNNWIAQTYYMNEKPFRFSERVLEYANETSQDLYVNISETSKPNKTTIKMNKVNGVYEIPAEINGIPMNFIFDTGASVISISATEATFLYKQGKLSNFDILENSHMIDATGTLSSGTIINLKSVKLGNRILTNVEASVVHNLEAPLLMGQSALEQFGKILIDYQKGEIILE